MGISQVFKKLARRRFDFRAC